MYCIQHYNDMDLIVSLLWTVSYQALSSNHYNEQHQFTILIRLALSMPLDINTQMKKDDLKATLQLSEIAFI
jgi:hypothetical protein